MIDIPVAGMFSAGEIAPIQGATFVHSYSSAFGLVIKGRRRHLIES
jgi:small ligand-binding sensory domain FIST